MKLRALGVMAIVLALVVSMAGLASADTSSTDTSTTSTTLAPSQDDSSFQLDLGFEGDLLSFVLYWGGWDYPPSPCEPVDTAGLVTLDTTPDSTTTTAPVCLDVNGPNGQVNHGTFVSAFVHWLKSDEGQAAIGDYSGPRGKLVKQAAKSDFGKGQWKKDQGLIGTTDVSTPELADAQDDGPGHGNGKNK